jgi:hypothetical protein
VDESLSGSPRAVSLVESSSFILQHLLGMSRGVVTPPSLSFPSETLRVEGPSSSLLVVLVNWGKFLYDYASGVKMR